MKRAFRDPLRPLRETAVTRENLGAAEFRSRRVSSEVAAAIRRVPAQRRAARVRKAAFSAASMLVFALAVVAIRRHAQVESRLASVPAAAGAPASAPSLAVGKPADVAGRPAPLTASIKEVVGEITVARAGAKPTPITRGARIETADQLVTGAAGSTTIELAGGATAVLSASTNLRVTSGALAEDASAVRLALRNGKVELRVPHMGTSGSLAVVTDDAEVVVHGTVFSVEVGRSPFGRRTCVTVSEGIVGVRRNQSETRLLRGAQWSSLAGDTSCGGVAAALPPLEEAHHRVASAASSRRAKSIAAKLAGATRATKGGEPAVATKATGPARAERAAERAPAPPRSASPAHGEIALENRLFQRAVVAAHRGDDDEALRLFDELVQTYPDSALAPEAAEQRREVEKRRQGRVPNP